MPPKKKEEPEESGDDIPFKKPSKQEVEVDDDEEEEEEYAVEKIISHHFKGKAKKLVYVVKWVGYDETTQEPEENLDNCPDELDAYFKTIGGKPQPPSVTPASTKKRTASETAAPTGRGRGANGKKVDTSDMIEGANGKSAWKAPPGSWEDEILAVDSMTRDPDTGENIAYIVWNNKHKSRHATKLLNQKCPQKLLQFYEAHLFFGTTQPGEEDDYQPTQPVTSSGTDAASGGPAIAETQANGDDEDEEMEGVKAVASG